jgi:selenide,water dikinase
MEEVLFDPQTSGGLLVAVSETDAEKLLNELKEIGLPAEIVGEIIEPDKYEIYVD